ncbi:hypothetical protein PM082_003889 [Marasmius tenuissimus]|nr:hypothetical protein PM082_003889 [Marasmius tenuissimus]
MSRRPTATRWGDPSLMTAWIALKEATEIFAVETRMGKISRLAIDIVDAAQLVQEREGARLNPETSNRLRQNPFVIIRPSCLKSRLLRVFKPNNRAFNELVYDAFSLVSSLVKSTRRKGSELDPNNDPAKLSPTLLAHLQALQMTLQEIKDFAQRRTEEPIWKLHLSAKSDLGRIRGFRERLRRALAGTIEHRNPRSDRAERSSGGNTRRLAN